MRASMSSSRRHALFNRLAPRSRLPRACASQRDPASPSRSCRGSASASEARLDRGAEGTGSFDTTPRPAWRRRSGNPRSRRCRRRSRWSGPLAKESSREAAGAARKTPPKAPRQQRRTEPEQPASRRSAKRADAQRAVRKAAGLRWMWPTEGKTIGRFTKSGGKGIDIAGAFEQPIHAGPRAGRSSTPAVGSSATGNSSSSSTATAS